MLTKFSSHCIFLFIATIFGLLWMVFVPPFQAADEFAHFYRAYEISELNFVTENVNGQIGNYLPKAIHDFEEAVGAPTITRHPEKKEALAHLQNASKIYVTGENLFYQFPSSAVYHPIVYLPQAIGIKLGNLLHLNLLYTFYLGRLLNLVVYITMTFFAIKLIPKLKYTLLLLAIIPMTINQAASFSADALTNASLFLFFAYIMHLSFNPDIKQITRKQFFILLCLAIIVAAVKNAYFLTCLLVLLIPKEKATGPKQYYSYISAIIASSLFVILSWAAILKALK